MWKPRFITPIDDDVAVPYVGLSMREIFNRFVVTGQPIPNSQIHEGNYNEYPENAISSESDPDEKVTAAVYEPETVVESDSSSVPESTPKSESE